MRICEVHARDLANSARAVQTAGHPNVAYHLAVLSLEELGRRELIKLQAVATARDDPPSWLMKATTDHVKKLFWCFYG
jgi:AbiV family abortive infection protein